MIRLSGCKDSIKRMLHRKKNVARTFRFMATTKKNGSLLQMCKLPIQINIFTFLHFPTFLRIFRGRHAVVGLEDGREMSQVAEADAICHL